MKILKSRLVPYIALIALLALASIYEGYVIRELWEEKAVLGSEKVALEENLAESRIENEGLKNIIADHELTIETFGSTIENISDTVGGLEKLSKLDEELLKKYSKIYFLNENYIPPKTIEISEDHLYNKSTDLFIHAEVEPYLSRLLRRAERDGITLLIASAYRSFGTQAALKQGYTVVYGSGANQFSADQGYSEHQLGTTVDFTTPVVGAYFANFSSDPAYQWLLDNAHKYGFVLSYPSGNTYYKFEPWHWRFVGVDLATRLHSDDIHFYDLDQREIDAYLIRIFD